MPRNYLDNLHRDNQSLPIPERIRRLANTVEQLWAQRREDKQIITKLSKAESTRDLNREVKIGDVEDEVDRGRLFAFMLAGW